MTADVDELEQRARSMTDWRYHLSERPLAVLGVAAAGGALIGMLTGGSRDEDRKGYQTYAYQRQASNGGDTGVTGWVTGERGPSVATEAGKDRAASKIDEMRSALMALAVTKAEEFLSEALPGFSQEVDKVHQKSEANLERSNRTSSLSGAQVTGRQTER